LAKRSRSLAPSSLNQPTSDASKTLLAKYVFTNPSNSSSNYFTARSNTPSRANSSASNLLYQQQLQQDLINNKRIAIRSNSNNYYKDFMDEFNTYSSNLLSSKSKASASTSMSNKPNADVGPKSQIDKIILIKNTNESGAGGTSVIAMMIEKSNSKSQIVSKTSMQQEQPKTDKNGVEEKEKTDDAVSENETKDVKEKGEDDEEKAIKVVIEETIDDDDDTIELLKEEIVIDKEQDDKERMDTINERDEVVESNSEETEEMTRNDQESTHDNEQEKYDQNDSDKASELDSIQTNSDAEREKVDNEENQEENGTNMSPSVHFFS
jgi:hypothetical protein